MFRGKTLTIAMRPKGEINLRRDCLELVSWKRCNIILSERVSEVGGRGFQSIRWHPSASEHSAFGIRTTYRTFLFVAPDGDAASWLRGLNEVCARCEIYEGIDQLPLTPRRASLPATQYQHREQQQQQQRQQQQKRRQSMDMDQLSSSIASVQTSDTDSEDDDHHHNDHNDDDDDDDEAKGGARHGSAGAVSTMQGSSVPVSGRAHSRSSRSSRSSAPPEPIPE